jgi:hypothetical protein
MRNTILALVLTALTLTQMGCATGFRASGPRGNGVAVGAGIGATPTPVYVQPPSDPLLPPAPPPPAASPPR